MAKNMSSLRRSQLDQLFAENRAIRPLRPKHGWVKEIRNALSMSQADLAARLGVIQQRIEKIEKTEVEEKVSLETMHKIAEALDCNFVYYLEPKSSLEKTFESQARRLAEKLVKETNVSMNLEKQGVEKEYSDKLVRELAEKFIRNNDKKIWKTKL